MGCHCRNSEDEGESGLKTSLESGCSAVKYFLERVGEWRN
jgi:hypothetical protein